MARGGDAPHAKVATRVRDGGGVGGGARAGTNPQAGGRRAGVHGRAATAHAEGGHHSAGDGETGRRMAGCGAVADGALGALAAGGAMS